MAELPGRGSQLNERPFTRLEAIVEFFAKVIKPYLDRPFAFFGHSMGAMISFELARQLSGEAGAKLAHLFVSGRRAPQIPHTEPITYNLPTPELIEELRRLNGTPAEVLNNPELMHLMLPLLRADFEVVETYVYSRGPALGCPITAFGGLEDKEVSREEVQAWREQTADSFSLKMLPGGHFFLHSARGQLLRMLSQELSRTIQARLGH
jgi:medium-chain acyl-[acyl-carrier-protein] hydrolase